MGHTKKIENGIQENLAMQEPWFYWALEVV